MSFDSQFPLATLKEVAKFINGDRSTNYPKGADYIPNGIPFISAADLGEEGVDQHKVKRITKDAYERLRSGKIQHKDILFCLRGSIGKMAFVKPEETGAIASSLVIVRASPQIDSRYLNFLLCSQAGQQAAMSLNNGSAQPNLSVGQLQQIRVPLPSLNEQIEIAAMLGSLDDRITLLRETNATLEAIAQALFKSWFVDFDPVRAKMEGRIPEGMDEDTARLFPDGLEESELGLVPRGWRNVSLKEAVSIHDSKRIPLSGQEREKRKGQYPYYGAAALMDSVDDYLFDGVYLLTGEDGSVADKDGYPIMQYVWSKFWVNNHAHILQGKDGIATEHVMLAMKRTNITPYITGAVQAKLSQTNMWRINFLKPTRAVAEHFGSLLEPLFVRFRHNSEQAQTLATLRDTLLPRLISGQLRLPEAESMVKELVL